MKFVLLNIVLAAIPSVFVIVFIYRKDRGGKEPSLLVFMAFTIGFLAVIPAVIIEILFMEVGVGFSGIAYQLFRAFAIAGLVEEGVKLAAVRLFLYKRNHFNEVADGILYTIAASLGFAFFENILYSFGPASLMIVRGITAVPLHASASGILGYYIGNKSIKLKDKQNGFEINEQPKEKKDFFVFQKSNKTYIPLLIIHILAIPLGLYLLNSFDGIIGFSFIGAYILGFGFYYRSAMRRLRKPVFWIQLVVIVLLSALFWDTEKETGSWVSMDGIYIGLEMIVRALFIVTAFTGISVELHNQHVRNFLFNIGLGRFYQAVGMAFGALPIMISLLPTSKEIFKNPMQSLLKPLVMADQWLEVFKEG